VPSVTSAFEGSTDEPIILRLATLVGADLVALYPSRGKGKLDQKLSAYNQAARHSAWFVLRDFDHDADCPQALIQQLLPHPSDHMCLRLAVRASEAWLLADRAAIGDFIGVRAQYVPADPETLTNPKEAVIALARRSKRRAIRDDIVPKPGATRVVGPGYTARMVEYALKHWNPTRAANNAPSLKRCIVALKALAANAPH
jgi:hypothetical protein